MSRNQIKFICSVYMVLAHILFCFYATTSILGTAIYTIGEFVPVLFAYFVAEGYIYSSNKLRYGARLLIFGLISQPFYMASIVTNRGRLNIIILFALCVFTIYLYDCKHNNTAFFILRPLLFACILVVIRFCEGDYLFFILILIFYNAKVKSWSYEKMFLVAGGYFGLFYLIVKSIIYPSLSGLIYFEKCLFGVAIAYLILKNHYNPEVRQSTKFVKYSFYLVYPLHYVVIGLIHLMQFNEILPKAKF